MSDPRIQAVAKASYDATWDDNQPDAGYEYDNLQEYEQAALRDVARGILAAADAVDPMRIANRGQL